MLNIDIGAYKKDIESSWLYKIGKFSIDNWIAVLVTLVVVIVARALFNNVVFPYYFEEFKKLYRFEKTLSHMKDVLEEDYSDLWHESEFCLAFLALQDEQQRFLRLSKSDSDGENPRRFHWANRYAKVHIK